MNGLDEERSTQARLNGFIYAMQIGICSLNDHYALSDVYTQQVRGRRKNVVVFTMCQPSANDEAVGRHRGHVRFFFSI